MAVDEDAVRVRQLGAQRDRVRPRIRGHVDEIQTPGVLVECAVREAHTDLHVPSIAALVLDGLARTEQITLRHRELHVDGIATHDRRQGPRGGTDQIAHRVARKPDAAGDRRRDRRIAQIEHGPSQSGLGKRDARLRDRIRCLQLVDRGLRDILRLHQLQSARQLGCSVQLIGPRLFQIGLALLHSSRVLTGLDHEEDVAHLDLLTLREATFFEETLDPGTQIDPVDREHTPHEGRLLVDDAGLGGNHDDRGRRHLRRRGIGFPAARQGQAAEKKGADQSPESARDAPGFEKAIRIRLRDTHAEEHRQASLMKGSTAEV